jgi:hypothetical protein
MIVKDALDRINFLCHQHNFVEDVDAYQTLKQFVLAHYDSPTTVSPQSNESVSREKNGKRKFIKKCAYEWWAKVKKHINEFTNKKVNGII